MQRRRVKCRKNDCGVGQALLYIYSQEALFSKVCNLSETTRLFMKVCNLPERS
ncbi:hypothetical protein MTR67_025466 [Solanum verrucosum]|uniref:Uncharacterized protein n=1 Tax=Solanum verrucosum TaxID=315347 RepID=A0AAF0R556_SOLVR|nr:hypothetical protein MTR67_025466 [Solanum verrucosum]